MNATQRLVACPGCGAMLTRPAVWKPRADVAYVCSRCVLLSTKAAA